jgi:predicted DNA-binding protein with PD1-like motif
MLVMKAPGDVRVMMVSFRLGDYIIEELRELFKKEGIDAALITSGIGSMDICKLHTITGTTLPPASVFSRWRAD